MTDKHGCTPHHLQHHLLEKIKNVTNQTLKHKIETSIRVHVSFLS